jgi:23S rRNA (guanosine2251-2'-O)-methyltransferase
MDKNRMNEKGAGPEKGSKRHSGEKREKHDRGDRRPRANRPEGVEFEMSEDIVFGRNSVSEAIKAGREINKILVAEGSLEGSIKQIIAEARTSTS